MEIKTVTICGGGSLGHVCAGVLLAQGYKVNLLTGHPEKWSHSIIVKDNEGKEYAGRLTTVSSIAEEVIPNADVVLLCLPGYLIEKTLLEIKPWLNPMTMVGSIVSSTGFFFFAHKVLNRDTLLFGFQRVPFISRVDAYGKSGRLLGYKNSVNIAFENVPDKENVRQAFEKMFITPVVVLDSFYEASLTNSNPILHTGRLYAMWHGYNGEQFDNRGLFYTDWTDEASEYLIAMDSEFMMLLDKLGISGKSIPTLLDYYESTDAKSLTEKIKSIEAFKTILSPMKQLENGKWIPDFSSRYFTEDFPYGLKFIKELGEKHDIHMPTIDKVFAWGMCQLPEK